MNDNQGLALYAVSLAIQMETDGREYYLRQAELTTSEAGRVLFQQLAREELDHRVQFEAVFEALSQNASWPHGVVKATPTGAVETLFREAALKAETHPEGLPSELVAVDKAIEMENASCELYQQRLKSAVTELEKNFYRELAAEERGHYMALLDYRDFLTDPNDWFTGREHHSFDGV